MVECDSSGKQLYIKLCAVTMKGLRVRHAVAAVKLSVTILLPTQRRKFDLRCDLPNDISKTFVQPEDPHTFFRKKRTKTFSMSAEGTLQADFKRRAAMVLPKRINGSTTIRRLYNPTSSFKNMGLS